MASARCGVRARVACGGGGETTENLGQSGIISLQNETTRPEAGLTG
jgi:hypothetical protein